MEIRFEHLVETDLEALNQLDFVCFDIPWGKEKFLEEFRNENAMVLGAFSGLDLVGAICLRLIIDELWIFRFMTDPKHRRHKIAARLLNEALFRKKSFEDIWLEVSCENHGAISFYEKEGFITQQVRPDYYPRADGRGSWDAFIMKKDGKL